MRLGRKYKGPLLFHKTILYFPEEVVDYLGWSFMKNEFTSRRVIPISKIIGREVKIQE